MKKILCGILIISFIFSPLSFLQTKKASATGLLVNDVTGNILKGFSNGFLTTLVGHSTANNLKSFSLDGLAWMMAKMLVKQLTAEVVNWINSGFEGSPAFVKDPGAFFLDLADQATGQFLTGGLLAEMCSPFSIDIKIALSFKYHPNIRKRYTCTISTIIKNSTNAVKNASINGFTAGDFKQGGWPAFVSLTSEPQNNIYGAYLEADQELSLRVGSIQLGKKEDIGAGRGFMSWEKCKMVSADGDPSFIGPQNFDPSFIGPQRKCTVETPGSVIAGSLDTQMASAGHSLELADSINEIVGSLASTLVSMALKKGLGAMSGSGPSDSASYMNKVRNEISGTNEEFNKLKNSFLDQIDGIIKPTRQYRDNKNASLNLFLDVKGRYESARNCYTEKLDLLTTNNNYFVTRDQVLQYYRNQISIINSTLSTKIIPVGTTLYSGALKADEQLKILTDMRNAAATSTTLNDLNKPSNDIARMVNNNELIGVNDVQKSQDEYVDVNDKIGGFIQDSQRLLQGCQVLPIN